MTRRLRALLAPCLAATLAFPALNFAKDAPAAAPAENAEPADSEGRQIVSHGAAGAGAAFLDRLVHVFGPVGAVRRWRWPAADGGTFPGGARQKSFYGELRGVPSSKWTRIAKSGISAARRF